MGWDIIGANFAKVCLSLKRTRRAWSYLRAREAGEEEAVKNKRRAASWQFPQKYDDDICTRLVGAGEHKGRGGYLICLFLSSSGF
jgi:hypothetical protein